MTKAIFFCSQWSWRFLSYRSQVSAAESRGEWETALQKGKTSRRPYYDVWMGEFMSMLKERRLAGV